MIAFMRMTDSRATHALLEAFTRMADLGVTPKKIMGLIIPFNDSIYL